MHHCCRGLAAVSFHLRSAISSARVNSTPRSASLPQEALIDCVKRVVFQENAPMGQPAHLRFLIGRSQEAGVVEK